MFIDCQTTVPKRETPSYDGVLLLISFASTINAVGAIGTIAVSSVVGIERLIVTLCQLFLGAQTVIAKMVHSLVVLSISGLCIQNVELVHNSTPFGNVDKYSIEQI